MGDQQLLDDVVNAAMTSPTAKLVIEKAGSKARVRLLSEAEMSKLDPGAIALHSNKDDVIYLNRDQAAKDPEAAAIYLAHETVHVVHDPYVDQMKQQLMARINPNDTQERMDQIANQGMLDIALATETEAHMVEARVGTELGLKPQVDHPGMRADGTFATADETFEKLIQSSAYNPHGLQPSSRQKLVVVLPEYRAQFGLGATSS